MLEISTIVSTFDIQTTALGMNGDSSETAPTRSNAQHERCLAIAFSY